VLNSTTANVLTTDSDQKWIETIDPEKAHSGRLKSHWVDLGELGDWGRPVTYSHRRNFAEYTDWMWLQKTHPDVVLIDGRFRVCCFLTTLRHAAEGTKILFDDYVNRKHYHIVEEFVERSEVCGRQCLFVVPPRGNVNLEEVDKQIDAFRNVFD
jgi:hypothetical protein